MNSRELMNVLLYLDKWTRRNKSKITHPIRAKHFLEDMSYVLHWLDDESINAKVQQWRNQSVLRIVKKIYGIKKEVQKLQ